MLLPIEQNQTHFSNESWNNPYPQQKIASFLFFIVADVLVLLYAPLHTLI